MPALPRPALCLLLLAACAPVAAQKVMQPGAWEMQSQITRELPGQPPQDMGKHTVTSCLEPEFLARNPYLSPQLDADKMAARQAKCSVSDYDRQGDQARWRMQCETADGSQLDARFDNQASASTLNMQMAQDIKRADGAQGRVIIRMQGRHVGPCTPGMHKPGADKPGMGKSDTTKPQVTKPE